MNELSDDDLVCRYAAGDETAFAVLFARHHAGVFGYALVILRNRHDAEEVLVDAFAAAARNAIDYRPEGRFRAWLLRIARNGCLSRLTRERRRAAWQVPGQELTEPASEDLSPAQSLSAADDCRRVAAAFARLPPRLREALGLYTFEHLRYDEISVVLESPINTVKTWIRRARMQLARELETQTGAIPREIAP